MVRARAKSKHGVANLKIKLTALRTCKFARVEFARRGAAPVNSVCSVSTVVPTGDGCHTRQIARRLPPRPTSGRQSRKVDESGAHSPHRRIGRSHGPDPMSMFEQPVLPEEIEEDPAGEPAKRPPRWSPSNWSVRWKVVAIVVIPLAVALALGGLRGYNSVTDARDLRLAADRAHMVRPIQDYIGALESAVLAYGAATDGPVARKAFDDSRGELQRKLSSTNVDPDVRADAADGRGRDHRVGQGQRRKDPRGGPGPQPRGRRARPDVHAEAAGQPRRRAAGARASHEDDHARGHRAIAVVRDERGGGGQLTRRQDAAGADGRPDGHHLRPGRGARRQSGPAAVSADHRGHREKGDRRDQLVYVSGG